MLCTMPPYDDTRLADVLRIYADDPLADGDAVLSLNDAVCCEIAGLADHWDDVLRVNTAQVIRETATKVAVAIARRDAALRPEDFAIWRDLHAELRDSGVELLPVKALPAA
jgi:hypothetical protein